MCYSVTALYRRYRAVTDFETRVTISKKSVCHTGQSAGGRIAQLKFICSVLMCADVRAHARAIINNVKTVAYARVLYTYTYYTYNTYNTYT